MVNIKWIILNISPETHFHSSMVSASSGPASGFLPEIPALTLLYDGLYAVKWNKHFFEKVAYGHGIYYSKRMKSRQLIKIISTLKLKDFLNNAACFHVVTENFIREGTVVIWMWNVHMLVFSMLGP